MSSVKEVATNILNGGEITLAEAESLFLSQNDLDEILYWSNKIRQKFKGNRVKLCSIINAKSGLCPEDCKFCSQSLHNNSEIKIYPLVAKDEIVRTYEKAKHHRINCFGIVTSGDGVNSAELEIIGEALKEIRVKNPDSEISASLGKISLAELEYLKSCGLTRYHHNLETSESFFSNICSTHSYADRLKTLEAVKRAGLKLCSGGIFGVGEDWKDRLELGWTLKEMEVDSVPLNFLNPIKGTKLENSERLLPAEILKIIAMFRFVLPDRDIKVCGGREVNLRDLQSWIFYAGANGMMTGGYLTTSGRNPQEDRKMIEDLGLEIEENG